MSWKIRGCCVLALKGFLLPAKGLRRTAPRAPARSARPAPPGGAGGAPAGPEGGGCRRGGGAHRRAEGGRRGRQRIGARRGPVDLGLDLLEVGARPIPLARVGVGV